jgi:hypothetical protein
MPLIEPVELRSVTPPQVTESSCIQNVSSGGARAITQRIWQPGTRLQVTALRSDFQAQAVVVYWRSFSSSKFAIGLKFLSKAGHWPNHN